MIMRFKNLPGVTYGDLEKGISELTDRQLMESIALELYELSEKETLLDRIDGGE